MRNEMLLDSRNLTRCLARHLGQLFKAEETVVWNANEATILWISCLLKYSLTAFG